MVNYNINVTELNMLQNSMVIKHCSVAKMPWAKNPAVQMKENLCVWYK